MHTDPAIRGVSFDLFGTLVSVEKPADPAAAIATELAARGVAVPDDWADAYGEMHVEVPSGAELSLPEHVAAALASRDPSLAPADVHDPATDAVRAAFETPVRTRPHAAETVAALAERLPVGVLSNCSVPGLAERALADSDVDETSLDAIVTSVDCGWRKPDRRAFAAVADALAVDTAHLLHVGDDPQADGGAAEAGARSLLVADAGESSLGELPALLEGRWE